MFNDRQLLRSCLLLLPLGMQRRREGFVHDTRCASISQAYAVGIGRLPFHQVSRLVRHQSPIGTQSLGSFFNKSLHLNWIPIAAWEIIGRDSWEIS